MAYETPRARWRAAVEFLFWGLAFSLACGQAPLYYSNQNQYFLHGLADAGLGYLADDWLARTADPTPIFSALVSVTARWLHPAVFHLYHGLLLAVYFASLTEVCAVVAGPWDSPRLRFAFRVLLVLVHGAAARWLSYRMLGLDYPYYFQGGVAGQYVLGGMLQPSMFGVFLVGAVALFLRDRPFHAAAALGVAATVHPTYLLPAALLSLAYLQVLNMQNRLGRATAFSLAALAAVVPVLVFLVMRFRPTSPSEFAEAQRLLTRVRIPHHCLPVLWFDRIAAAQLGWVVLAVPLCRVLALRALLAVPFLLGAALTVLAQALQYDTLLLLFPWRVSVVLVPVATAVVLAAGVRAAARLLAHPAAAVVGALVLAGLVLAGVAILARREAFQSSPDEAGLMHFAREQLQPGQVYLLPVRVPNLQKETRGSLSSDFKPAAVKRTDGRVISPDLVRFRLHTGAPIYVDFKSVPYRDVDVLEWRGRLERAQLVYDGLTAGKVVEAVEALRRLGVSHVVTPADLEVRPGLGLKQVYADTAYRVYRREAP